MTFSQITLGTPRVSYWTLVETLRAGHNSVVDGEVVMTRACLPNAYFGRKSRGLCRIGAMRAGDALA